MRELHPHLKNGKNYVDPFVRETAVENITLVIIPAIAGFFLKGWRSLKRRLGGTPKT